VNFMAETMRPMHVSNLRSVSADERRNKVWKSLESYQDSCDEVEQGGDCHQACVREAAAQRKGFDLRALALSAMLFTLSPHSGHCLPSSQGLSKKIARQMMLISRLRPTIHVPSHNHIQLECHHMLSPVWSSAVQSPISPK
jgi:hypothetical protein